MMDGAHLPMAGDRLDALKSSCSREECSTLLLPLLVFLTSNEIINGRAPTWVAGVQSGASSGGHWQKEIQRWRPKLIESIRQRFEWLALHRWPPVNTCPFIRMGDTVAVRRGGDKAPYQRPAIFKENHWRDTETSRCLFTTAGNWPSCSLCDFLENFFFSSKTKVNKVLLKRHQRPFWSGMCDGQVSEVLERAGRFQGRPFPFSRSTFLCSVFLNDIPPWMEGSCWRIVNA